MRPHHLLKLFTIVAISGCTRVHQLPQNAANRAPSRIDRSFGLNHTGATAVGVDRARVSIAAASLEKEFLLHTSIVPQEDAPGFSALKSRVVFFRRAEGRLILIEASRGLLLTKDYPQTLPLAEFPILETTAEGFVIDFNSGMNRLLLAGDWRAHEHNPPGGDGYVSVKLAFSYLSQATMTDDWLEVHQTSLAELHLGSAFYNVPLETVFYLTPYHPNPEFRPTRAPRTLDAQGFFEVQAQWNDESGSVAYASKIDVSKTMTYAISANTPEKYRAAIRDGVRYWNQAFGRTVVDVVDAPAGVTTPSPRFNVIRWVDWESAHMAYADAQMDPRTGEILHHQIYLTSSWARHARREIKRAEPAGGADLVRRIFRANRLCDSPARADHPDLTDALDQAVAAGRADKVISDMIRAVVAHEVGHTLGLRHNFAGSLGGNYELAKRDQIFKGYLEAGEAPADLIVSTSIMDYLPPFEDFFVGDQIARAAGAMTYDEQAIRSLYFGREYPTGERPLFCTDSQTETYADCARFDAGSSFVGWVRYNGRRQIELLPKRLLEGFVEAKVPEFGMTPVGVAQYHLDGRRYAAQTFDGHAQLTTVLRRDQRLLSVERQFPNYGPAFRRAIEDKTNEVLTAELAVHGGFEGILLKSNPKLVALVANEFERVLSLPNAVRGRTIEGHEYEFTVDELAVMRTNGRRMIEELQLDFARAEIAGLTGRSPYRDLRPNMVDDFLALFQPPPKRFELNAVTRAFAEYLVKRTVFFLFAPKGEPTQYKRQSGWISSTGETEGALGEEQILKLPAFAYPYELRLKSAELLKADRGESPAWGHVERRVIGALIGKMFAEAVPGVDPSNIETLDGYPNEAVRWVLEARELGSLFDFSNARLPRSDLGKPFGSGN